MLSFKVQDLVRVFSPSFDLQIKGADNVESIVRIDKATHYHFPIFVLPQGVYVYTADGQLTFQSAQALLFPAAAFTTGDVASMATEAIALPDDQIPPVERPKSVHLPFRQCAHFRIDQASWWDTAEQVVFGATRFVPANPDMRVQVFRPEYHGYPTVCFLARVSRAGDLEVNLEGLEGKSTEYTNVLDDSELEQTSNRLWHFKRQTSADNLELGDRDKTVISFEPNLVSVVWMITYHHVPDEQTERYIIVVRTATSV